MMAPCGSMWNLLRWKNGGLLMHSVQTTHFDICLVSFLGILKRRSTKTAFSSFSATNAFLDPPRSPDSGFWGF